ncbi:MAG: formate--tetrahydrofolate ligase [bacterium]|nr:formate--tetrahydrofolate ligase [Deltaproteobacteria bacterium]MCP4908770.1 formate--tetrahydrofolate ligase [bacterium]
MPSDIEIAQAAEIEPIEKIAAEIGLQDGDFDCYGRYIAKLSPEKCRSLARSEKGRGKLILVTAMSPTPAGEGKTTTCVGLADSLRALGQNTMLCLREPSLGPCFGMKGGAAGGGYSQVLPMEEINLHFTGDFHAIGLANNLLSAAIDNHIHFGNELGIDPRRITWPRVVDMNDRALRGLVVGMGGVSNSVPREDSFQITVASEVMACFCLCDDLVDLKRRIGNIVIGHGYDRQPICARDLKVDGAMAALLKDAIRPNLVQTMEHTPTLIHGGPFANIAHGANSIIATRAAMQLADYVVTEAGFGSDLGAEKFMNIVCRKAGFSPDVVVMVATLRALKMHGGVAKSDLGSENLPALSKGLDNLKRHIENVHSFGVPVVVTLNRFDQDTAAEVTLAKEECARLGVDLVESRVWQEGSGGGGELAETVIEVIGNIPPAFRYLYPDDLPLWRKVETIARKIYGARDLEADKRVRKKFRDLDEEGYGQLPICMAKTQYSFSSDPKLLGAPSQFDLTVRDVRLAAGAEFVVVYCGEIMTMPGLPRVPSAEKIDVDDDGRITGLF